MIPWIRGKVAQQAHVKIPDGTCEEEYARSGFFGKYAHLYRSAPPINWNRIEGNLKPRAYNTAELNYAKDDYCGQRQPLMMNDDVRIGMLSLKTSMNYFMRDADSDLIFFTHLGNGCLETDFGQLHYRSGDYLYVPRGTVFRIAPSEPSLFLHVESASEFRFPDRGMLGQHALFDPAVIEVPDPSLGMTQMSSQREYELKILREGELTSVFYPNVPINTIGWKGTLSAWRLNVADIRPVSSDRYHLPPSAHTTLVADNFVICSFLPRPLENGDPDAMKVPFYHSNIDYDEVLFYHAGDFFSRTGIGPGMITLHPQGIHHGPQPNAVNRTKNLERTNEVAIMIDTRRPLKRMAIAETIERTDYWKSWGAQG
jgi:homogentisate 1,2-dioxygenase